MQTSFQESYIGTAKSPYERKSARRQMFVSIVRDSFHWRRSWNWFFTMLSRLCAEKNISRMSSVNEVRRVNELAKHALVKMAAVLLHKWNTVVFIGKCSNVMWLLKYTYECMVVGSIGLEFRWNIERMTLGGSLRHLSNTNFENIVFSEFNLTRYLNHDLSGRIIKQVDNISKIIWFKEAGLIFRMFPLIKSVKLYVWRKKNAYNLLWTFPLMS